MTLVASPAFEEKLFEDDDGQSDDEDEGPQFGVFDLFIRSWAWRKFMSLNSTFLAASEDLDIPPEPYQTLGGDQLEVKPSPGCGLGVFAVHAMAADRFLDIYEGILMTDEEVARTGQQSAYMMELGDGWSVDSSGDTYNWTRYMNHSEMPNVEWYIYTDCEAATHSVKGRDGRLRHVKLPRRPRVEMWTLKAIQPGEELRIDYGPEYADQLQSELRSVGRDLH